MHTDTDGARTLPEQRDGVVVPAERVDVVVNPAESQLLIHQTHVSRSAAIGSKEHETQRADPILHRNDDDVIGGGQYAPVVQVERRRAAIEAAAVDPHHDRPPGFPAVGALRRRPHVQVQAVFAHICIGVPGTYTDEVVEGVVHGLVARGRSTCGVAHPAPGVQVLRPLEAPHPGGR